MPNGSLIRTCQKCGAEVTINNREGNFLKCPYCGELYEYEGFNLAQLQQDLNSAECCLEEVLPNFTEARRKFEEIIEKYPESAEAYWGVARAKFGVQLVSEEGKSKPICFKSFDSGCLFTEDEHYKKAVQFAYPELKREIQELGAEIDKNIKIWNKVSPSFEKYDVFIAFKNDDVEIARGLYRFLKKKHLKVFFSEESIRKNSAGLNGVVAYEPIIYDAIMNCKVMVVIASKPEFFFHKWLRSEWNRFRYRQNALSDETLYLNALIDSKITANDVPDYFKHRNFYYLSDPKYKDIIYTDIRARLREKKSTLVTPAQVETGGHAGPIKIVINSSSDTAKGIEITAPHRSAPVDLPPITTTAEDQLKNARRYLQSKNGNLFDEVIECCNVVIEEQPGNIEAEFYLFLAKHRCRAINLMPVDAVKKFSDDDYRILENAINYFDATDVNEVKSAILKYLCTAGASLLPNYKLVLPLLNSLSEFKNEPEVVRFVGDRLRGIKTSYKLPISNDFFNYVNALFTCIKNENYLREIEDLVKILFKKHSYSLINSILTANETTLGELAFYKQAKTRLECKVSNDHEMINYFVDKRKYEEMLAYIQNSESFAHVNDLYKILAQRLVAEIGDGNFDYDFVSTLADNALGCQYENKISFLDSIVIPKLLTLNSKPACDLLIHVLDCYSKTNDAVKYYKIRIDSLMQKKEFDLANLFIVKSISIKENNIENYYKKALCNLKSQSFQNINKEYLANYFPNEDLFHAIYSLAHVDGEDSVEIYCQTIAKICNAILMFIKDKKRNKNKGYSLLKFFKRQFPEGHNKEYASILENIVKTSLKLGYFDEITEYVTDLLSIEEKVDYYMYIILSKSRCHNEEELKHSLPIINRYPEFTAITNLINSNKSLERIMTNRLEPIIVAQKNFKKYRPIKNKMVEKKLNGGK